MTTPPHCFGVLSAGLTRGMRPALLFCNNLINPTHARARRVEPARLRTGRISCAAFTAARLYFL